MFGPFIRKECSDDVRRIDVVWDRYFADSLKNYTRDKRGQGVRMKVSLDTVLPKGWPNFLRDSENKQSLFNTLAQWIVEENWGDVQVITTCGSNAITNSVVDVVSLSQCDHEEADSRMMLHLSAVVSAGHTRALIRTGDTDVLVLAVSLVQSIPSLQLWVQLGTGSNQKFISAHTIANTLGTLSSYSTICSC